VPPKDATTDEADKTPKKRPGATTDAMRARLARIVRIVFGVLATILALGALLVVLGGNINNDNPIVKFIIDTADAISGPFSKDNGIFSFTGKHAESKNALLNWGIAAIVYLLIGRVLANLIAPKGKRS
jgi:hypothetical protein